MPGFRRVRQLADADAEGRTRSASYRKSVSFVNASTMWADLSMSSGSPPANYYASNPTDAAVLNPYRGLFHGDAVSPASLHLTRFELTSQLPGLLGQFMLLDYLLYYPFIDGDNTDPQAMDNTVPLPRYTGGDGVRAFAVATTTSAGGGSFTYTYTDQAGNARTSPTINCNISATPVGCLLTSQPGVGCEGPFLPLTSGSHGIRSIQSATVVSPIGGLFALVLVKPIFDTVLRETSTPRETCMVKDVPGCPRIYDGAYLNLITNVTTTSVIGLLAASADFSWSPT